MDRGATLVVAIGLGGILALQAPLNSVMARTVGGVQATIVAVVVTFFVLIVLALTVGGGVGGLDRIREPPLYVVVGGGVVGAFYVASIVYTVRVLGVGGLTAATIAGQLAVAMTIDHFGWLGVDRSPIDFSKLAGVALLAAGTYLIVAE